MHRQLGRCKEVFLSFEDTYVLLYSRLQEQPFDPGETLCAQRAFEHLVRVRVTELRKDRDVADRDPELCEHRRVASHGSVEMFA